MEFFIHELEFEFININLLYIFYKFMYINFSMLDQLVVRLKLFSVHHSNLCIYLLIYFIYIYIYIYIYLTNKEA